MALKDITRPAVIIGAIQKFDRIGRSNMRRKYSGGLSKSFYIKYEGRNYDLKLILRVAHELSTSKPLSTEDFNTTQGKQHLESLGFTVIKTSDPVKMVESGPLDAVKSDIPEKREARNIIYYGPPGTSKTYRVNQLKSEYEKDTEKLYEYVTFHQWLRRFC